jgi:hypothetical protein
VDESGELLAVYEQHRGSTIKPAVVLVEPPQLPGPSEDRRENNP